MHIIKKKTRTVKIKSYEKMQLHILFSLPLLITVTSSTKYKSCGNFEIDFRTQFCSKFDLFCDLYSRVSFLKVQTGLTAAVSKKSNILEFTKNYQYLQYISCRKVTFNIDLHQKFYDRVSLNSRVTYRSKNSRFYVFHQKLRYFRKPSAAYYQKMYSTVYRIRQSSIYSHPEKYVPLDYRYNRRR